MGPIETEFNPEDYPVEYVAVEVTESLSAALERVEDAWTRTPNVVLVIPRGAQAFHNTHDFLALGKLQGSREVRVSLATLDPIISGLGRLLGFYLLDPTPDHPALAGDPTLDNTSLDGDVEQPTVPLPIGGTAGMPDWVLSPVAPAYPPGTTTTSTWLNNPSEGALHSESSPQSWTGALSASPQRSGLPQPRTRPRNTGQMGTLVITDSALESPDDYAYPLPQPPVSRTPTGSMKARRVLPQGQTYRASARYRYGEQLRSYRWGRIFAIAAVVLALALAGASAYAYVYLPEATVSVTPLSEQRDSIQVEGTILTTANSQQPIQSPTSKTQNDQAQTAPSIRASAISTTLQEEGTRPASGTKQIPRGKGQGFMRFTNRTSGPVSVPSGTQFKASNGVSVQTTQAGTVPPTIFGQSFGTLDLPIAATVDGPDGNIPAGQIAGIYKNNLNYTNLALQGGTLDTVKVVTQADIDGLVAELRGRVGDKASGAMHDMVSTGYQLITQTIGLSDSQFSADHTADQEGDNVSVRLTATVGADVYKESDLRESISQAVLDSIQSALPQAVGPTLDLGSVQYTPPTVKSNDQGRITYDTSAGGRVTFTLTPELTRQVRELVKGKAVAQARNLILQQYGAYINPDSIGARVLWFELGNLPNNPSRITVQPSTAQGGSLPDTQPTDQGTPDPRSQP